MPRSKSQRRSAGTYDRRRSAPIKYEIRGRDGRVRPAFVIDASTRCWLSTGPSTGNGYRRTSGKPAHRDAYERLYGPLPADVECHHLCHNPECVNAAEHIVALSRDDHRKLHAHLRVEKARLGASGLS
jgi:hypothetical protein